MSSQSSISAEALISIRLVTMDYYMAAPSTEADNLLDPVYSHFRSAPIKRIPILRVFGTTPAGQKACLHLHGIFPYLYIPMPPGDHPGFLYRLASSLDKAINLTMAGNAAAEPDMAEKETGLKEGNPSYHHVFKIVEVTGRPYYGYHAEEHRFAKIYLYNPRIMKRAADLLLSGAVMGKAFQPHYSHVPYTLQFMMDYNLQGMSLIHLKMAKFRHDQPAALICDSSQTVQWQLTPASQKIFKLEEMTMDMLAPDSLKRTTTCQLELDAVAADVLNTNDDLINTSKRTGNPGLEFIWQDERLRRLNQGLSLEENPLTPPNSPPRLRSPNAKTSSEEFWEGRFEDILNEWREKGISDTDNLEDITTETDDDLKKTFYPDETVSGTDMQSATFIEQHVASLTISESQRSKTSFVQCSDDAAVANSSAKMEDSQDLFEDTVIDEAVISQFLSNNTDKKADDKRSDTMYLDSDDDELVELLIDLQGEKNPHQVDDVLSQVKSSEKYQREVEDTLEMSQIWNDDDFDAFIARTEAEVLKAVAQQAEQDELDEDTLGEEESNSDDNVLN